MFRWFSISLFLFWAANCVGQTPYLSSSLKIWISADSANVDGLNRISKLFDQSGYNNHALQGNLSQSPTLIDSISELNYHKVIHLDGIDDFLEIADSSSIDFNDSLNIYLIFRPLNPNANHCLMSKWDYKPDGSWCIEGNSSLPGEYYIYTAFPPSDGGGNYFLTNSAAFSKENYNLMEVKYDGTQSSTNRIQVNSNSVPSTGTVSGSIKTSLATSSASIKIGRWGGSLSRYMEGEIAELLVYDDVLNTTQENMVMGYFQSKYAPIIQIMDTVIPYGFCAIEFNAYRPWFSAYLWPDLGVDSSWTTSNDGVFTLKTTDWFGLVYTDTFEVKFPGNFSISGDTIICPGDSIIWDLGISGTDYSISWHNGSTDSLFPISDTGKYWVIVTDTLGCTRFSDTLSVFWDELQSSINLGSDTSFCKGGILKLLTGDTLVSNYLWSNGDTLSQIQIDSSGVYALSVTNSSGCSAFDTITLSIKGQAPVAGFIANDHCYGDSLVIQDTSSSFAPEQIVQFEWTFGDGDSSMIQQPVKIFSDSGNYIINLSVKTDSGCYSSISKAINVIGIADALISVPELSCQGFDSEFKLTPTDTSQSLSSYFSTWSLNNVPVDSGVLISISFPNSGYFELKGLVQNSFGCKDSTLINLDVKDSLWCVEPTVVGNLVSWLRSSGNQLITDSNNMVIRWLDLSGMDNHGLQNDASFRPTVTAPIPKLNNRNALQFDGINDFMEILDTASLGFNDSMSVVILFNRHNQTGANALLSKWDYKPDGSWCIETAGNYPEDLLFYTPTPPSDGGGNFFKTDSFLLDSLNYVILDLVYNGGESLTERVKIRKNTLETTGTVIGNLRPSLATSQASIKIFQWGGTLTRNLKGNLLELLIFNSPLDSIELSTIHRYFQFRYTPPIHVNDVSVNYGFCPVIISGYKPWFKDYSWPDLSSDSSWTNNKEGLFQVEAIDIFNNLSSDFFNVDYPGNLIGFRDTVICPGDTIVWDLNLDHNGYSFNWSDLSIDSLLEISDSGEYFVEIRDTNGCIYYTDTIKVIIDSFYRNVSLGPDNDYCRNSILELQNSTYAENYLWSTGDTTNHLILDTTGMYSVVVFDSLGCEARDTIFVVINGIAPVVGFISTDICSGDSLYLNDTSIAVLPETIVNWSWIISNGDTLSVQNPIIYFPENGLFSIALTVTTDSGCFALATDTIIVHPLPQPSFNVIDDLPLCQEELIEIENSVFGTIQYSAIEWYIDQVFIEDSTVLIYAFSDPGSHQILLSVTDTNGCINSIQGELEISSSPEAFVLPEIKCEKDTSFFINNSNGVIVSSVWMISGNNMNSTHASQYFDSSGFYNGTLLVSDFNGCTDSANFNFEIPQRPIIQLFSDTFCLNQQVQIYDSSFSPNPISFLEWKVGNSQDTYHGSPLIMTFSDTGIVDISVRIQDLFGCQDSTEERYVVVEPELFDFIISPLYGSPPLNVSLTGNANGSNHFWDFGDSSTDTNQNPNHLFTELGEYSINYFFKDPNGCNATASNLLKVINPFLDLGVSDVEFDFSTGIHATVTNYGNLDIYKYELGYSINGSSYFKEMFFDTLIPGRVQNVQFTSKPEVFSDSPPDVCLKIILVNDSIDHADWNNKSCIPQSGFRIKKIFPNPGRNFLNVEVYSEFKGELILEIFNCQGKLVQNNSYYIENKGLTSLLITTHNLVSGVYLLQLSIQNEKDNNSFIIINEH